MATRYPDISGRMIRTWQSEITQDPTTLLDQLTERYACLWSEVATHRPMRLESHATVAARCGSTGFSEMVAESNATVRRMEGGIAELECKYLGTLSGGEVGGNSGIITPDSVGTLQFQSSNDSGQLRTFWHSVAAGRMTGTWSVQVVRRDQQGKATIPGKRKTIIPLRAAPGYVREYGYDYVLTSWPPFDFRFQPELSSEDADARQFPELDETLADLEDWEPLDVATYTNYNFRYWHKISYADWFCRRAEASEFGDITTLREEWVLRVFCLSEAALFNDLANDQTYQYYWFNGSSINGGWTQASP